LGQGERALQQAFVQNADVLRIEPVEAADRIDAMLQTDFKHPDDAPLHGLDACYAQANA
jgi:hypothetical protein